jgi:hypothetical protein
MQRSNQIITGRIQSPATELEDSFLHEQMYYEHEVGKLNVVTYGA